MNQPVKNATFLQPGWSRCITNYDAVHCYLHVQKVKDRKMQPDCSPTCSPVDKNGISDFILLCNFGICKVTKYNWNEGGSYFEPYIIPAPEDYSQSVGKR